MTASDENGGLTPQSVFIRSGQLRLYIALSLQALLPKVFPDYKREARLRIIEAAAKAFTERGYHGTTMDDIASELGVSKGALYLYFKSKEGLVREICKIAPARLRENLYSSFSSGDVLSGASEFFERSLDQSISGLGLYFEILAEAHRTPTIRKVAAATYRQSLDILIGFLAELKGIIGSDTDTELLARGLIALHDGLMASMLLGTDAAETKKAWNEIIRALVDGIKRRHDVQ